MEQQMTAFTATEQNRVNRHSERGRYGRDEIYPIIDEALVCHVGIVADGQPFVIPTIHARVGDMLYLHGAVASRLLKHLGAGNQICAEFTLLDGIVFARAVFSNSMNYRSAVLFGEGRLVEDEAEKMCALEAITEHVVRGRWAEARLPSPKELAATLVVAVPIVNASAKVRSGPPSDVEEDLQLPVWAGVLPFRRETLPPLPDPKMTATIPVPQYIAEYGRE
jgi:uncharacterized protein